MAQGHRHGVLGVRGCRGLPCGRTDAWLATATALMVFGVAGEIAGARATGPGSFAAAMLDAIYALDGEVLVQEARVAC